MPLTPDLLRKWGRRVFVETGTDKGGGVEMALAAGAEQVLSIELNARLAAEAMRRFADDGRVTVLCGDSATLLGEVLAGLGEPALVWLDAHEVLSDAVPRGPAPVLQELAALAAAPRRDHAVLIDDIRVFREGSPWRLYDARSGKPVTVGELESGVRAVNLDYRIEYLDAHEPKDILAAWI